MPGNGFGISETKYNWNQKKILSKFLIHNKYKTYLFVIKGYIVLLALVFLILILFVTFNEGLAKYCIIFF